MVDSTTPRTRITRGYLRWIGVIELANGRHWLRPASPAQLGRARPPRTRGRGINHVADRGAQSVEVGRAEDHAVARGDVDQVEVDAGPGDLAGEVGEDAGPVLDVDHDDLALARDREVGDRQRVRGGLGVRDEDVELGPLARADAGGGGDVDAGVADRGGDLRQRPGVFSMSMTRSTAMRVSRAARRSSRAAAPAAGRGRCRAGPPRGAARSPTGASPACRTARVPPP